jgi:AcrR family transcriptional regulator
MKLADGLTPAPQRGKYDRALSRRERQAEQRERVIAAVAALITTERSLNVASVVELARIGRNTFYEYFDDIEHALVAIKARALRDFATRLESALHAARTPLERIRALARAWAEYIVEAPTLARVALRAQAEAIEPTQLSVLAEHVSTVLNAELAARTALPGLADPLRTIAVAALFDAISRSHLTARPLATEELQRTLSELALRLLR